MPWFAIKVGRSPDPAVTEPIARIEGTDKVSGIGDTPDQAISDLVDRLGSDLLSIDRTGRKICLYPESLHKYFF